MAKRFTDTNKYKKPFIRSLPGAYKLLWDFLYHDCDHAGIWIVEFETAQIFVGKDMRINCEQALKLFNLEETRIVILDSGKRWFLPSFIDFQYGQLSEKNRAHLSVISILSKYGLLTEDFKPIVTKPLTSPLQGAMDMVKDKDMVKDMEKDKGVVHQKVVKPFESPEFNLCWENWKIYRSQSGKPYKSEMSEQAALKKLSMYSESTAIKMIEESIANSWQGLFEIKENNNGKPQNRANDLIAGFAERAMQVAGQK